MKRILILSFIVFILSVYFYNISYNKTNISYINIINKNYIDLRDETPPLYFIYNNKEKINILENIFEKDKITSRLKYKATLISHTAEEEIIVNGIYPKNDKYVFAIINNDEVNEMNMYDNSIIISDSTAKALGVDIGDNIILKIVDKNGYYNANEYRIISINNRLEYDYALVNIDNLQKLLNLENVSSEIYIKSKKFYKSKLIEEQLNDDELEVYTSDYFYNNEYKNNKVIKDFRLYILIIYFLALLSIYFYLVSNYSILNISLYSFISFIITFTIYLLLYGFDSLLDITYLIMFIINFISIFISFIFYKIFNLISKKKIVLYSFMIISYILILYFAYSIYSKNNINTIKIVKLNSSDNTFLFNGIISNKEYIKSNINNSVVNTSINFPALIVIRTGNTYSRIYSYENNTLENGNSILSNIIDGDIFDNSKREIVIGKNLAEYLNIKVNDVVSILARSSRGWLDTLYFTVSGIFDIEDKNFAIISSLDTMYNFLYIKDGISSPYNESLIINNANKTLYKNIVNLLIDSEDLKVIYNRDDNIFVLIILLEIFILSISIIFTLLKRV